MLDYELVLLREDVIATGRKSLYTVILATSVL